MLIRSMAEGEQKPQSIEFACASTMTTGAMWQLSGLMRLTMALFQARPVALCHDHVLPST